MTAEAPNLVAGEERPAESGALLDKLRPADGTLLCRVARSGAGDAAGTVKDPGRMVLLVPIDRAFAMVEGG